MTIDITELAQSLKAAAVRAQAATEEYASQRISSTAFRLEIEEFESLANKPANILALVEKLELKEESRTVTVKLASRRLPSDYVDGEFGNDDLAAIHNACRLECKVSIEKYLSAYGIVVKWEGE